MLPPVNVRPQLNIKHIHNEPAMIITVEVSHVWSIC